MTNTLITVNGSKVTIPEARKLLGIPTRECFGCYLGDASPEAHDNCFLGEVAITDFAIDDPSIPAPGSDAVDRPR